MGRLSATRNSDLNLFSINILIFSFTGSIFTKVGINNQGRVFLLIIILLHILSLSTLLLWGLKWGWYGRANLTLWIDLP